MLAKTAVRFSSQSNICSTFQQFKPRFTNFSSFKNKLQPFSKFNFTKKLFPTKEQRNQLDNFYLQDAEERTLESGFPRRKWLLITAVILGTSITGIYIGEGYILRTQEEELKKRGSIEVILAEHKTEVELLRRLPLRFVSYIWGIISHTTLPEFLREPIYKAYAKTFDANLEEISEPLKSYRCMAEFFTRKLKDGARTIQSDFVSPVDGRVIYHGEVTFDMLEQIKGVQYSLGAFLGDHHQLSKFQEKISQAAAQGKKAPKLYHIAIYLGPGDYHGVHSPVNWKVNHRTHLPGYLFPVKPRIVNAIRGLFALNERVGLIGEWEHGFFSLTPVGATNVGSILIPFDEVFCILNIIAKELKTNVFPRPNKPSFDKEFNPGISCKKGENLAFFSMGSTVVIVFESPNFEFTVKPGERVLLGEKIGLVPAK